MKSFIEDIYFNREKEENWDLMKKAKRKGFSSEVCDMLNYTGYELSMRVEFFEDGTSKVLKIDGINVEDKDITMT
jgi:hypothetical protein